MPEKIEKSVPITDIMFGKACKAGIPLSGTFELSPVCNFKCRMCYVRKNKKEVEASSRPAMNLKQWMQIAEEARDAGMLYLLLTGGEPLIWPDFWELYEEMNRMGLVVSINTNGSLIDEKAVEHFLRMPPRQINITLYGANDRTYEQLCGVTNVFSRVDNAIKTLVKEGISVKLNCSLTPQNAQDLEAIVEYSEKNDLVLQVADYMFPPIRRNMEMVGQNERFTPEEAAHYRLKTYRLQNGREKYEQYLQSILKGSIPPPGLDEACVDLNDGKIRCRAGKASFWITWDGWMAPCGMMTEPRVEMRNRFFCDAWKELISVSKEVNLSGVCGKCPNVKLCHSCAAMALAETGTFSGIPIYLCETVQAMKKIAEEETRKIVIEK